MHIIMQIYDQLSHRALTLCAAMVMRACATASTTAPLTSIVLTSVVVTSVVVTSTVLGGCAFFTTRTPEPPDTRRSSFQPPTSAQVVIANFQSAIREKNAENYVQCLVSSDGTMASTQRQYQFEPSAEASARFASVFIGWNVSRERQAFLAMNARILPTAQPALNLSDDRFEVLMPDSAVYVADYSLRPNYDASGLPEVFTGRMRLTIAALPNGFWAISRWSDQQIASAGSTSASWSILKAQFAN